MTTCKIILTPTTKEPKICHALATTSAFNLKLCLKSTAASGKHVYYGLFSKKRGNSLPKGGARTLDGLSGMDRIYLLNFPENISENYCK